MPADPARVESLFHRAAALPPADRPAFLAAECGDDAELLARVEQLLAAADSLDNPDATSAPSPKATRSFADAPAAPVTTAPHAASEVEGAVVAGRYKLLQQIGEGGMGTVWMADQTQPVKRRVAVKLIRTDRGQSKTILSRFEAERQAIALMNHPHIAKLFDAGTTETGQPFFVMELVRGVPLTEFCDAHKLSIPDRLRLFAQVCGAVQHAHQKGIIHRDLKPTNILVESHDGKPVPKVIDFGLAKATTGLQLTEHTLFTGFGSVMGTPLYMAPEQATFNAVDIDTRADVYALGVILYELLTGTTPLTRESVRQAALDEMLRLVREQDAPTPSSRLSSSGSTPNVAANRQSEPAKLGRFLRGELDWIALKALSKDRDRRYDTATNFARDVERFLNHEPVTAGPPGVRYKLRKFVRRNRGPVIAASLVLFSLVAGVAGTAVGLARENDARRNAEAAWREEAHQRGLAGDRLAEVTREKDRAERLLKLAHATHADLVVDLHGAWAAPAKLRDTVFATLAEHADAMNRELAAQAAGADAAFQSDWAAYVEDLAGLFALAGQAEKAAALFEQATAARQQLHTAAPANRDYAERLGKNYRNRGVFLSTGTVEPAAIGWYDRAVSVLRPLVENGDAAGRARAALLDVFRRRADALMRLGRDREAVEQWDAALRLDTGEGQLLFRHYRAIALAGVDYRGAAAEVEALAGLAPAPGAAYLRGSAHARISVAVAGDATLPEAERHARADGHAETAVRLIRDAAQRGFGSRERFVADHNLNSLRGRADFQKFLAEVEKK